MWVTITWHPQPAHTRPLAELPVPPAIGWRLSHWLAETLCPSQRLRLLIASILSSTCLVFSC
jgi:hypothetical protein